MERKDKIYLMIGFIPTIGLVGLFVYGFIGWNIGISFTDWIGLTPNYELVGIKNYVEIFTDSLFWNSFINNIHILAVFIPATLALGLFLASLMDETAEYGGEWFKNVFLFPFALSYVVTGTFWAWLFNPSTGGINQILDAIGLGFLKGNWITDPDVVIWCIIIVMIWQFAGYVTIILLAGMKGIPESQVRAAQMDGASSFKKYKDIIIPQIKGPFFIAFVVLSSFGIKIFSLVWVLTGGGPGTSSFTLSVNMYEVAFSSAQFAEGAGIATIMMSMILVIIIPYMYKTIYQEE